MEITCPHCSAVYRVPDSLVDGTKPVRCVACVKAWVPVAPAGLPAEVPSPSVALAVDPEPPTLTMRSFAATLPESGGAAPPRVAERPLPEPPRRRKESRGLALAWTVSLVVVTVVVLGLAVYRAEVAAFWPPFARLAG